MDDPFTAEMEVKLVAANASIVTLTASNLQLTRSLSDAEARNKKLKRRARRDEKSYKEQIVTALGRHG